MLFHGSKRFNTPWATIDTIVMSYLPALKWKKEEFWHSISKTMLLSDVWLEEFQQCIIRKHNGHIYFTIKVWLQSYTRELGRSIRLFQGSVFSGTHCIGL